MQLTDLTKQNAEQVRQWRNPHLEIWRTSHLLTESMQADWYENDVCNRNSKNRWWAVSNDCEDLQPEKECLHFIGMVGLCNISLENRNAELTIIINPDLKQKGYGTNALKLLLDTGFNQLNLENIYSETYECNPNIEFWKKILTRYNIYNTILPARKYWNGKYWDSIYFNFNKKDLEKMK